MNIIIAPSVLASNLANLEAEVRQIYDPVKDHNWVHLDVMDGDFVSNITFGAPVIKCLRKSLNDIDIYFDCHLMVSNPEKWLNDMKDAGVNQFMFHYEAVESNSEKAIKLVQKIKELNMDVGISIKPNTKIDQVVDVLNTGLVHTLLIMTVEPGFGGQKFLSEMMSKVEFARRNYPNLNIQVDGGINFETLEISSAFGANIFVAGTFIYKEKDRLNHMEKMHMKAKAVFKSKLC